jgi:hypothetical protein
LAVTPREEITAFGDVDKQHNPMRISESQSAVLLYCMLDNDAEITFPLFRRLVGFEDIAFDERVAGDLLPDIIRELVTTYRNKSLPAEDKDRLSILAKIASNVEKWKGKPYTGGGARQEAITARLEPYCDLGLVSKPAREKYEYKATLALRTLLEYFDKFRGAEEFLQKGFFTAFAACRGIDAEPAADSQATRAVVAAGGELKSSLGYTPITDVGLLAGSRLLSGKRRLLELNRTVDLLKVLQKEDPSFVRFTVDRMGSLAFVKFLKSAPGE